MKSEKREREEGREKGASGFKELADYVFNYIYSASS
jgi:hypothetical protein